MFDTECTRTVIRTANYDACYRYYRDVLQFPLFVEYSNEVTRGACFGTAVWGIEIVEDATAGKDDQRARNAMEVADVHALREQLAKHLPDVPQIEQESWAYSLIVADPDGYRIKFFTRRVPAGTPGNLSA